MSAAGSASSSAAPREFCYRLLEAARRKAAKESGYDSAKFRTELAKKIQEVFGYPPHDYQLDVGEALELGLDCVLIAGTGAGKTLTFIMTLLLRMHEKKTVIIISPLNELQRDQARRFNSVGISATPVNASTWSKELEARIKDREFRVLLTSPEMLFTKTSFSQLAHTPSFMSDVNLIVADEAHCIVQWGGNSFRPLFAELGALRSLVPLKVPVLAASATMTPKVIDEVKSTLSLRALNTFELNLGNNRKNITHVVVKIKSATDFDALRCLIDGATEGQPLVRTLVYVLKKEVAQDAALFLRSLLPPNSTLRDQIDFANSARDPQARTKAIQAFMKGIVNVLFATEVAGMGLDIRDIARMMHLDVPETPSEAIQHYGRAGRDGRPAYSIMLVPIRFFDSPKSKAVLLASCTAPARSENRAAGVADSPDTRGQEHNNTTDSTEILRSVQALSASTKDEAEPDDEDPAIEPVVQDDSQIVTDDVQEDVEEDEEADDLQELQDLLDEYLDEVVQGASTSEGDPSVPATKKVKKGRIVDDTMRMYVLTEGCRRDIINEYFKNPPMREELTAPCCDHCLQAQDSNTHSEFDKDLLTLIKHFDDRLKPEPPVVKEHRPRRPVGYGDRKLERLASAKAALEAWRRAKWKQDYKFTSLSYESVLPDDVLGKLALRADLRTVQDLKAANLAWPYADKYGAEVLEALKPVDEAWNVARTQSTAENAARRRVKTVENAVQAEEERRQERFAQTARKRSHTEALAAAPSPVAAPLRPLVIPRFSPIPLASTSASPTSPSSSVSASDAFSFGSPGSSGSASMSPASSWSSLSPQHSRHPLSASNSALASSGTVSDSAPFPSQPTAAEAHEQAAVHLHAHRQWHEHYLLADARRDVNYASYARHQASLALSEYHRSIAYAQTLAGSSLASTSIE